MSTDGKTKRIFNRLLKKHKVSLEFITFNFEKILKFFKYATEKHFVIKKSLIIKRHKVVIKYNALRTNLFSSWLSLSKKKRKQRRELPWSKRAVQHLKWQRTLEKNATAEGEIVENEEKIENNNMVGEEEETATDHGLSSDDIQKKIKEQLELLKNGKKTASLFGGDAKRKMSQFKKPLDRNTSFMNLTSEFSLSTSFRDIDSNLGLNENISVNEDITMEDISDNESNQDNISERRELVPTRELHATNRHANEDDSIMDFEELNNDNTCNDSNLQKSTIDREKITTSKSGIKFLDLLLNKMKKVSNDDKSSNSEVNQESDELFQIVEFNDDDVNEDDDDYSQMDDVDCAVLIQSDDVQCQLIDEFDQTQDRTKDKITKNYCEKRANIKVSKLTEHTEECSSQQTLGTTTTNGEDTSSTSSTEFLGFSDFELATSSVPGLLPTPIVSKSNRKNNQSAFISEDLENFLRENSLENVTQIKIPSKQKNVEEGLVCDGAQPPKMVMPVLPDDLVKSRTVAEKRNFLQKKQSIKYYMIENENTIYRELKKRTKAGKANLSLVRYIQNLELPSTRDCWKASSWLSTENGRFYFQILNVDGLEVKLIGGKGNYKQKYMKTQISKPYIEDITDQCPSGCRQNVDFRNVIINLPSDDEYQNGDNCNDTTKNIIASDLKLQIGLVDDEKFNYKPGPLSRKCLTSPFEPNLGELEIYEMPDVQLEVFPAIDQPLDESVKPYLKLILPSDCITREWAEFAVSTLITDSANSKGNNKNNIENQHHPKSFTFTIPYLNNQKNVLVRKVYNRKEMLEKFSTEDFNFQRNVDPENEIAIECADILSEMINSVAIGLSEDSLIKDDPDIDYFNNNKTNEEIIKRDTGDEQSGGDKKNSYSRKRSSRERIISELKKLNATVIDAETMFKADDRKCKNAYCKLGCVCQSLSGQPILRKHCKKSTCMLECTCRRSIKSDIGELLNSSLTSEHAQLIRRKATAKLAKVEKDFCATLVLTDNETFLINEPTNDGKRSKRAPKRFDDYSIDEKHDNLDLSSSSIPKLYPYDDEPPPKKFKHCNVTLTKLIGLEDVQPWCMVHCLYKCFCKGRNVTGVPFEIKKEETVEKEEEEIVYSRRRLYSFDRSNISDISDADSGVGSIGIGSSQAKRKNIGNTSTTTSSLKTMSPLKTTTNSALQTFEKEIETKRKYYNAGCNLCKRVCAVPSRIYHNINQRRATKVLKQVQASENLKTKFILVEKINKSLRYNVSEYKEINNDVNKSRSLLKINQPNVQENNLLKSSSTCEKSSNSLQSSNNRIEPQIPIITSVCTLNNESELYDKLEKAKSMDSNKIPQNCAATIEENINPSCLENVSDINSANNSSSSSTQSFSDINNFVNELPKNAVGKYIHSVAIKKLNAAVTKTMRSICAVQKRNTKHIPAPVINTFCSQQWALFLQAYKENLLHIWEIRIAEGSFYAATIINIMPLIPTALSVINIKAIPKKKLPLMGQMLRGAFLNAKTKTLSVLMAGHRNFWRILGFINSSYDYLSRGGVFKPTPQSHPWLSKKINLLFRMLICQKIKEQNILASRHGENLTNNSTNNSMEGNHEGSSLTTHPNVFNIQPQVKQINNKTNPSYYQQQQQQPNTLNNFVSHYQQQQQQSLNENIPLIHIPQSNLEIRQVNHNDIFNIVIPIDIPGDHRWLVLNLVDDFSHIYIPSWKNFLSHARIKDALVLTRDTRKIVRIGQDNVPLNVFATPDNRQRIYIGPYNMSKEQDIVLYQNIDSHFILREDFEKSQNIWRTMRTFGFWLYRKNGKLIFDMELSSLRMGNIPTATISNIRPPITSNKTNQELVDDDCMIVEETAECNSEMIEDNENTIKISNNTNENNVTNTTTIGIPELTNAHEKKILISDTDANDYEQVSRIIPSKSLNCDNISASKHIQTQIHSIDLIHSSSQKYVTKRISAQPKIKKLLNIAPKINPSEQLRISSAQSIGNVITMKAATVSPNTTNNSNNFLILKKSTPEKLPPPDSTNFNHKLQQLIQDSELPYSSDNNDISIEECKEAENAEHNSTKLDDITISTVINQSKNISSRSRFQIINNQRKSFELRKLNIQSKLNSSKGNVAIYSTTPIANTQKLALPTKVLPSTKTTALKISPPSSSSTISTLMLPKSSNPLLSNVIIKKVPPDVQIRLVPNSSSSPSTSSSLSSSTVTTTSLSQLITASKIATPVVSSMVFPKPSPPPLTRLITPNLNLKVSKIQEAAKNIPTKKVILTTISSTTSIANSSDEEKSLIENLQNNEQVEEKEVKISATSTTDLSEKSIEDINEETVIVNQEETISKKEGSETNISKIAQKQEPETKESNEPFGGVIRVHLPVPKKVLPPQPEFGYIVSNCELIEKFPVKKIENIYLLKMPHLKGILRICGIETLNRFLSQHMKRNLHRFPTLPPLSNIHWKFVPHNIKKVGSNNKVKTILPHLKSNQYQTITSKFQKIVYKEQLIANKEQTITNKEQTITNKDQAIANKEQTIANHKDQAIVNKEQRTANKELAIVNKEQTSNAGKSSTSGGVVNKNITSSHGKETLKNSKLLRMKNVRILKTSPNPKPNPTNLKATTKLIRAVNWNSKRIASPSEIESSSIVLDDDFESPLLISDELPISNAIETLPASSVIEENKQASSKDKRLELLYDEVKSASEVILIDDEDE